MVAGGLTGMLVADFGADVVKVERPGTGDPLRSWTTDGLSLWWNVYGRNKRYITLNLQSERGQAIFLQLLLQFDVLVQSFMPGTLERWELGWSTLDERFPQPDHAANLRMGGGVVRAPIGRGLGLW
jgi:formyl-CoA transferase